MMMVRMMVNVFVDRDPPYNKTYIASDANSPMASSCFLVSLKSESVCIFPADVDVEFFDVRILLIVIPMLAENEFGDVGVERAV